MDTTVYIDGYNLYYGRLKHSSYKWLDLEKLFSDIIHDQNPSSNILSVKYFTADVKAKFSTHGRDAHEAQQCYCRALKLHCERIEIIKGYHDPRKTRLPRFIEGESLDRAKQVAVWRIEEKQTDVNIALHMYHDAMLEKREQVVLVSNDSDLQPVLEMIRANRGDGIDIGVITPCRNQKKAVKIDMLIKVLGLIQIGCDIILLMKNYRNRSCQNNLSPRISL